MIVSADMSKSLVGRDTSLGSFPFLMSTYVTILAIWLIPSFWNTTTCSRCSVSPFGFWLMQSTSASYLRFFFIITAYSVVAKMVKPSKLFTHHYPPCFLLISTILSRLSDFINCPYIGCLKKMLFLLMVIWLFCKYKNNLKGLKPFMESALIFFLF